MQVYDYDSVTSETTRFEANLTVFSIIGAAPVSHDLADTDESRRFIVSLVVIVV